MSQDAFDPVVEASGLVKRYGAFEAVRGIDFAIPRGVCFAFLGPNGAGKSSTIRMIACQTPVGGGVLSVLGEPAGVHRGSVKARIGVVSQEDNLDPDLDVLENLTVYARYFSLGHREAAERAEELLAFMQLNERRRSMLRELSGGMRRRLVIARALMHRPDILILDEPTTGLDPQARLLVWAALRGLRESGVTLILTTHYMEEASRLADRILVMDQGRILAEGSAAELVARTVGVEAVEIDAGEAGEGLASRMGDAIRRLDRHGEGIVLYSDRRGAVAERLAALGASPARMLVRPTNLEDVFLTLTGRELRE